MSSYYLSNLTKCESRVQCQCIPTCSVDGETLIWDAITGTFICGATLTQTGEKQIFTFSGLKVFITDQTQAVTISNFELVEGTGIGISRVIEKFTFTLKRTVNNFAPLVGATTVTLTLSPAMPIEFYRNGVLQLLGTDYSIVGTLITVSPAFGLSSGGTYSETATALYQYV